jgi:uncharacterized protein YcnI
VLKRLFGCFLLAALIIPAAAEAHVTLNPTEWEAGGFARFDVRVPNERPNADTTKVMVQLPEGLFFVSFQPKAGWKRTIKMEKLAEPVEVFGDQITERVASVTWSGGRIAPGEFDEFGVSFRVPETPGESLVFPSLQTYSNGEVVRWIDPDPEAETPAPQVLVTEAAQEEAAGAAATTTEEEASSGGQEAAPEPTSAEVEDNSRANLALTLGVAGLVAGLAALALALLRRPRTR